MKLKKVLFFSGLLCSLAFQGACAVKKEAQELDAALKKIKDLDQGNLTIQETDWDTFEETVHGITKKIKTLKSEKLKFIQGHFSVPSVSPVTVPESNGFEIYRIGNVKDLKDKVLIHPKLFVSPATDQGSILGYRTGERDTRGQELITLSIPVALVNGLVPAVQIVGGGTSASGRGMQLPDQYIIPDVAALTARVSPSTLETLPACPTHFTLRYANHEYQAESPFKNLSICPVNQFFRIKFQAPESVMRRMLEHAAIHNDGVTITADLQVNFSVPKKAIDLSIRPDAFRRTLVEKVSHLTSRSALAGEAGLYSLPDLERAVEDSFFAISRTVALNPESSENIGHAVNSVMNQFFTGPRECPRGGFCRTLTQRVIDPSHVRYQWTEAEVVAASIRTQTESALGAVRNSSPFMVKPARSILERANRPRHFRGMTLDQILNDCGVISEEGYPDVLFPNITPEERPYAQQFCRTIQAYAHQNPNDPGQLDSYSPFGANTIVYPGAWIKIDVEKVEEFTSAKTMRNAQGNLIVESELKDMLAADPHANGTVCVEGAGRACIRYATHDVLLRDNRGNPIEGDIGCQRGERGCNCRTENGVEICTRRGHLSQSVMQYDCDAGDRVQFCPYSRSEETIIGHKKEFQCQNVVTEKSTPFLCIGGCFEKTEHQCTQIRNEPITATREVPNCIESVPPGQFPSENSCRNPHYLCEEWSQNCRRYSVNESFQMIHEEPTQKWRRFLMEEGELPNAFEDQIDLKFVSPGAAGMVSNCRLSRFAREFRGHSHYIRLPSADNQDLDGHPYLPCTDAEGAPVPLWNPENQRPGFLPKVYIKNLIQYPVNRFCGRTEYQINSEPMAMARTRSTTPPEFRALTHINIGPVENSCWHENPWRVGNDLMFTEFPLIRFTGKISVLGRMFESLMYQDFRNGGGGQ